MVARHERGVGRLVARPHDDKRRVARPKELVQLHLRAQLVRGVENLALLRTGQQLHVQPLGAELNVSVRLEQAIVHGDDPRPRRLPLLRRHRAGRRHEPKGRTARDKDKAGQDVARTRHSYSFFSRRAISVLSM